MRLIDADAFLERTKKDPLFPLVERYGLSGVIEHEPTVDAVPVVRCKDCIYRSTLFMVCTYNGRCEPVNFDDFCSMGERKWN